MKNPKPVNTSAIKAVRIAEIPIKKLALPERGLTELCVCEPLIGQRIFCLQLKPTSQPNAELTDY